jgi:hypothetical protein
VILPEVSEKQAASSLRASRTLLVHLAERVERETETLLEDNRDAEAMIAEATAAFDAEAVAPLAALGAGPESISLAALERRNAAIQSAIDTVLRAMPPAGREEQDQAALRKMLRGYLKRRQARERDMIFPAFLETPF